MFETVLWLNISSDRKYEGGMIMNAEFDMTQAGK